MEIKMDRRTFLRGSALSAASLIAASCAQPTPQVVEKEVPVEKIVKETVVVEKEVTVEKYVTSTPMPSQYNEAPMLAELVASGGLPPVDERLPESPLVVDVVEEIGEYGGTWRRAYKGVSDRWGPSKLTEECLVAWRQPEGGEIAIVPSVCEKYEVNSDATSFTWHLRKGIKWSDGEPLTTEDMRFWYEDLFLDEKARGVIGTYLLGNANLKIEILDEYTFMTLFDASNPLMLYRVANVMCVGGTRGPNFCMPAHFVKQFHPKYASKEAIDKILEEEGAASWDQLVAATGSLCEAYLNPKVPVIHAWAMKVSPPAERIVQERNPYFWQVDSQGNQLPYIDRIVHDLFDDVEVLNFKIIGGEIDCQTRHVSASNYTLFREQEEKGDYRIILWKDAMTFAYKPNIAYQEDEVLQGLFDNVNFRRALSVAIDRNDVNDLVFNGILEPRQACPVSGSPSFDPEWETYYAQYDPDLANDLLDELGLEERDADGIRLRPDGEPLTVVVEYTGSWFSGPEDMHLLTKEYWEAVGIRTLLNPVERSLYEEHGDSKQISGWAVERSAVVIANPSHYVGGEWDGGYGTWLDTDGEQGVEPPADHPIRKMRNLWDQVQVEGNETRRTEMFQQLLGICKEQLWNIGIAGESPSLFITKNHFRNVPAGLVQDDTLRGTRLGQPAQFFMRSS